MGALNGTLSVQTTLALPYQIVDTAIQTNMPSKEDWGSHIYRFEGKRDERVASSWVIYRFSWNPANPRRWRRYGILEVVSRDVQLTLLRLWVPSPGP